MRRIAWTTDIHLNFLGTQQIEFFLQSIKVQQPDSLIISGDIGEAPSIYDYLRRIADTLDIPIYFVLGNHDFYQSSIQHVRMGIANLVQEVANLHWLNAESVIQLTANTALIGHDSWSDGRYGDFLQSSISLSDYVQIQELSNISSSERLKTLNQLGDEAADHIKQVLPIACKVYSRVFVVIHSPPFQESCWHEGESTSIDNPYLPHFTCKAVGDVLLEVAPQFPECKLTVLCGHTHGSGEYHPLPNLHVITGGANYGSPIINRLFDLA
jgi:3',5'-cyclic-AMP phosphodiesterase